MVPKKRRDLFKWYLMIPCVAYLGYFCAVPVAYVFWTAFMRIELITPDFPPRFVGLKNFFNIFGGGYFWNALKITFVLSVIGPIMQLFLGLGIALALNQNIRGKRIITTLLLVPLLVCSAAAGFNFKTLYNVDYGPLNYLLSLVGLPKLQWAAEPRQALISIVLSHTWVATPFMMVLMFAGLASLPQEIYESAVLQSRSAWQTFIHITLPLLKPFILLGIVLKFIDTFRGMGHIYVITGGGPGTATENLAYFTYRTTIYNFDIGTGAALSILQLGIIIFVVSWLLRPMTSKPGEK